MLRRTRADLSMVLQSASSASGIRATRTARSASPTHRQTSPYQHPANLKMREARALSWNATKALASRQGVAMRKVLRRWPCILQWLYSFRRPPGATRRRVNLHRGNELEPWESGWPFISWSTTEVQLRQRHDNKSAAIDQGHGREVPTGVSYPGAYLGNKANSNRKTQTNE